MLRFPPVDPATESAPASRRALLLTVGRWLYAIAAAGATYALLVRAIPVIHTMLTQRLPWDGTVDWLGAKAFITGVNPYTPEGLRTLGLEETGFGHPPTTLFWFLPLTGLDNHMMSVVLGHLVMLLLFLHLLIVVNETRLPMPLATLPLVIAATLSTSWMQDHFRVAQVSELIAFAYVLAWYLLRRGEEGAAGAVLGLACTIKFFPGVMILMLALSRRWRGVVAAAVAFGLVAATMNAGFGLASWWAFFRMQGRIANQYVADVHNGSLHGIVLRLFSPSCHGAVPTRPLATAIAGLLGLLLLALAWRLCRRSLRAPDRVDRIGRIDLPFALFSVLSVFINPWSWEHYNVLLLLPLALVAVTLAHGRALGLSAWSIGLGLGAEAAALALLDLDMVRREVLWRGVAQDPGFHLELHLYEVGNWLPTVILLGLLGFLQYRSERAAPPLDGVA